MNAQQLKNAILQEAITGRLVPQDPNDEPASVLLDRIRKEKAKLVKEGKLKKKDLEEKPISKEEIPFEIPESWEWCRVSDISESFIGLTYKPSDVSEKGWIVLRSSNIQDGKLVFDDIVRVNVEVSEKLHVRENDIIICARNGSKKLVGKSALVERIMEPMTFGAFMAICRTPFFRYMSMYLLSPLFFGQLRKESDTTTINQLTQKNFNKYLVPLPPLSEQHRIVAKIEELLPKVEEYGKAQEALDKLNAELPERLKKSILQEAITGKLVPQNPNDEPASVLLDKIRKEKAKLVKEGKLKKKDLIETPISKEEIPFEIPESWEWVRINDIFTINPKVIADDNADAAFIPMEKIEACYGSRFTYEIRKWKTIKSSFTCFADGDVAFAKITPCFQNRKSMILNNLPNGIGAGTTELKVLRQYAETIVREYLLFFLASSYFIDEATFKGTANQQRIIVGYLENKLFPLPPLAEQHRIVAKIEELLSKIDKLKTK